MSSTRMAFFEPEAVVLRNNCSTTELHRLFWVFERVKTGRIESEFSFVGSFPQPLQSIPKTA